MFGLWFTAALLAIVAESGCSSPPPPPTDTEPEKPVRLVSPRGDVESIPREFRWEAVPGAERYRVTIADNDAMWPLFVKRTAEPVLLLDEKEASAVMVGRVHLWEVEAFDAGGVSVAKGEVTFRVPLPTGTAPPGIEPPGNPPAGSKS